MKSLNVAGLQMTVGMNLVVNEEKICVGIERAAKDRVDFLLTPEGSLTGTRNDFDRQEMLTALNRITSLAAGKKVGLVLGTCFKELAVVGHGYGRKVQEKEFCYNQVRIYSPDGLFLGVHNKNLLCGGIAHPFGQGVETSEFVAGTSGSLRTFAWRDSTFGALVCNDLWATPGYTTITNTYLPWQLRERGAEIIFHAVNAGGINEESDEKRFSGQLHKQFHEISEAKWAEILNIHIVSVNAAVGGQITMCRSGVVGPKGETLCQAPERGEQYFAYEIKI